MRVFVILKDGFLGASTTEFVLLPKKGVTQKKVDAAMRRLKRKYYGSEESRFAALNKVCKNLGRIVRSEFTHIPDEDDGDAD